MVFDKKNLVSYIANLDALNFILQKILKKVKILEKYCKIVCANDL